MKTSGHKSLEKYISHFIWKGCVWVGVRDRTELQHIDPHSYGHNIVSFPFSCVAQWGPGGPASLGHGLHATSPTATAPWGPPLLGAGSLYSILPPTDSNFLCTELYYCFTPTQFNLSTVKVIPLIPSTGCTCYLHRCISYFDSSAGVNMQQTHLGIFYTLRFRNHVYCTFTCTFMHCCWLRGFFFIPVDGSDFHLKGDVLSMTLNCISLWYSCSRVLWGVFQHCHNSHQARSNSTC